MRRRQLLATGGALAAGTLAAPAVRGATASTTIRFVPQADLSSLDPVWTTATVAFNHGFMVYDTLYGVDESLTPRPQMVAGHETSDDGLTWTFTLRDGLLFHDNEPVRAADCVASVNRWGKRRGFGQKLLSLANEIVALDDKRFRIRLKSPFPLMLFALGGPDVCFVMPRRSAEVDPFKQVTDPVGSGPFRFLPDERVSGSFTAWARWDKYVPRPEQPSGWAGGKVANVDRVEWRVVGDPSTAVSALRNGEVDWVENPVPDLFPMIRKDPGVRLMRVDPLFFPAMIALNHTQPPFNNEKLRRAIFPAVDQAEFMTSLIGEERDLMSVPTGVFTPGTPSATERDMALFTGKRDVALARRLVAESGYKGEPVVLMAPSDQVVLVPLCQVANSLFKEIGLNVDFQVMDWGTLVGRRALDKPGAEGGWNAFVTSWSGLSVSNPGSHLPLRGNGKAGWFGWPDSPKMEALRDRWFTAPDAAAQKELCGEMQALAFQEVPFVPIGSYALPQAMRANIQGVVRASNTPFWNVRKV